MITIVIDTKDKNLKKLSVFKRKPWQKPLEHTYEKAETLLDKLYTEMEEKGISRGTITCTLYYDNKEIECDPFQLDSKQTIFTLQDFINQDFAKSSNENTPKHVETLQRQINEEINQYYSSKQNNPLLEEKKIHNKKPLKEVGTPKPEIVVVPENQPSVEKEKQTEEIEPIKQVQETGSEPEIELELETNHLENNKQESNHISGLISDYKQYSAIKPKETVIEETLKTCDEQFIYDYFGLDKQEYDQETTDYYKAKHIQTKLKANTLLDPTNAFKSIVEEETTRQSTQLSDKYKEEMALKPEDYAKEKFDELYAPIRDRYNEEYNDFETEQLALLDGKKQAIETEKKAEIEAAIKEIELKYHRQVTEEETKVTNAIKKYKETLAIKNTSDKDTVFQSLITERITQRDQSLLDFKALKEKELAGTIEAASLNLIGLQQDLLDNLAREIEKELPVWTQTVNKAKEQRLLEEKQKEEYRLKQAELDLQEHKQTKEYELGKEWLEVEKRRQAEQKEREKKEQTETLNKHNTISQPPFVIPMAQQPSADPQIALLESKIEELLNQKKNQRSLLSKKITNIGMACLVIFSLTGFGYLAYANSQTKAELNKTITQQLQQVTKESNKHEATDTTSIPDLSTLLKERKFEQVYEKYNDKDSLKTIENFLLETGDLPQLKEFNKRVTTPTGKLNEAILSENDEQIIREYEKMENKGELTDNQKKQVKLAYYSMDRKEDAKKVGE